MKVRSPRVMAFVHEYVWGEHAGDRAACILAVGLCKDHPEHARKRAWDLLRQQNVRELYEAETAEKKRLFKADAVQVLERTLKIAMAEPDGEKIKTADVIRAQELFLKAAGELNGRLELTGADGGPLEFAVKEV